MTKNNSFSSQITQRYALALYELSIEKNKTEEFSRNLNNFIKMYNSNLHLKDFIKNPTNTSESQRLVFNKILSILNFDQVVKNFFLILIEKKRIFFLDKIIEEYLRIISSKRGEISANLISSKKIDEQVLSNVEKEISSSINRPIKLNYQVDENLIGGVVIQIGSLMIDSSVKSKLDKYKKIMIEN